MAPTDLQDLVRLRIRELRTDRGLTQEALCERAGISVDAVSRIEGGSRVPTIDTLGKIAHALGVAPTDLLEATAPPAPKQAASLRRLVALLETQPKPVQEAAEDVVRAVVKAIRGAAPTEPAAGREAPQRTRAASKASKRVR